MPRIRADTVAAHRDQTRAALLDAFGDLMAEVGYARLSLAQVAAAAGVARSTVYGYVADKEALLMAFVERSVEDFLSEVRAEMASAHDARGRLAVLVRRQVQQFRHEPGAGTETGMLDGATLPPASHAALTSRFQPLHGLLAEVISEGVATGELREVDPDTIVPMAFAVMAAERMPVGRGDHDADEAAARITDFLLHALGAST